MVLVLVWLNMVGENFHMQSLIYEIYNGKTPQWNHKQNKLLFNKNYSY